MVIRSEQMDALTAYMLAQFETRMLNHLKRNFREQTQHMDEKDLRDLIKCGIGRAAEYEVNAEDDVQRYLEYIMIYSPDFGRDPSTSWAREILCDIDLDGTEKMNRIDKVYIFSKRD